MDRKTIKKMKYVSLHYHHKEWYVLAHPSKRSKNYTDTVLETFTDKDEAIDKTIEILTQMKGVKQIAKSKKTSI